MALETRQDSQPEEAFEEKRSPALLIDEYPDTGKAIMAINDCRMDASEDKVQTKLSEDEEGGKNCE